MRLPATIWPMLCRARPGRAIAAALLVVALASGSLPAVAEGAGSASPRVVIVVGPAGSYTGEYRSIANRAARAVRRQGATVDTVYSPDATWPVVRDALQGASVVVYLGHGNGWPSRYRDHLYPPTQNGLGLNPVSGGGDAAHQYFGEAYLAEHVRLAPHAVVIMHRLCYASGNTEPGLPEGTVDQARQRVDNFGAGWQAAGADAVIADAFLEPSWYLNALFTSRRSIESIWRSAPNFHDHVLAFPSERIPGRSALLDPTKRDRGFYRSLVGRLDTRAGVATQGSVAGAARAAAPAPEQALPSLARTGARISTPELTASAGPSTLVAGGRATLTLPVRMPRPAKLPRGTQLGVRWDPITLIAGASLEGPRARDAAPPPAGGPEPSPDPSPEPQASPGPTPGPSDQTADDPPEVLAVVPEEIGEVVTTVDTSIAKAGLTALVDLPSAPGSYRLVTTVHDGLGSAFDTATQAMVVPLIVQVRPPVSVSFGILPELHLDAGTELTTRVRIVNDGTVPWSSLVAGSPVAGGPPPSFILATWAAIGAIADLSASVSATEVALRPGESTIVDLPLLAPGAPGTYLLILDLLTPDFGSLGAAGLPPAMVRVTVGPPPVVPAPPQARRPEAG